MRISDWSSDVCSSDLLGLSPQCRGRFPVAPSRALRGGQGDRDFPRFPLRSAVMTLDRRTLVLAGLAAPAIGGVARAQSSPPLADLPGSDEEIDLWPGGPPGMPASPPREVSIDRSKDHALQDPAAQRCGRQRLAVFRSEARRGGKECGR